MSGAEMVQIGGKTFLRETTWKEVIEETPLNSSRPAQVIRIDPKKAMGYGCACMTLIAIGCIVGSGVVIWQAENFPCEDPNNCTRTTEKVIGIVAVVLCSICCMISAACGVSEACKADTPKNESNEAKKERPWEKDLV